MGLLSRFLFCSILSSLLLVFGVTTLSADQTFLSGYMQTQFSKDSNIPIGNANKVIQTADGYIWIASYDGLVRYDGRMSKIYGKDEGFPTSNVTTIHEAPGGNLWIGTNDAGVVLYSGGKFTVLGMAEGMPANSIRAMDCDDAGNLYAATPFGIARVTPSLSIDLVKADGYDNLFARDLVYSREGNLWCVLDDGALVAIGEGGVVDDYSSDSMFGLTALSIFQASDGTFYFGTTANKVVALSDSENYFVDTSYLSTINAIYEDSEGRIWVCTDGGVGYIHNYEFKHVDGMEMDSSIENIFEDYEGGFWLSSSRKGVLHLAKGKFQNLSFALYLPELTVNATFVHEDNLYIGADEGLYILDSDGNMIENDLTERMKGIRVRSVIGDSDGNLWISTYKGYGIVRYRTDGTFVSITADDGLANTRVRCATVLPDGGVAVGTVDGLSIVKGDRVVKTYTKSDGLLNSIILCIEVDDNGVIYAGSDGGGIYMIDGDEITNINESNGLTSGIILRMVWDDFYSGMWVSMGNGVGFLRNGEFKAIDKLKEYASSVFDFKNIGYDELWILASAGVHICQKQNLFADSDPLEIMTYERNDGLAYSITANSWNHLTDRGELYLSCTAGVITTDTKKVYQTTPPKIAVNSVVIDDLIVENPENVVISSSVRRVTVNFALLSYASHRGNNMSVFLEGFDESRPELLPTDKVTQVSYTNLKGGDYVFRMKGINREGAESDAFILPIHKEYKLIEQRWVQTLLLLLATACIFGAAALRNRHKTSRIIRRQQEYRAITDQAIMAIADTIDAKDKYTSGHSKRVAGFSLEIAKRMGMSPENLENLYYTALLHDIGKIGLEDSILNKSDRLTEEEYSKMKRHVDIGGEILKSITVVDNIATGAKYHHERYDGHGYTEGLGADDIPLFARIICVADAYDAMSTDRPYRESLSREYIIDELKRCAGTQFDAKIVGYMLEVLGEA